MDKRNQDVKCLFLNPAPSLIKYGMHWGMSKIGCDSYLFDYGETALFDKSHEYQLKKIEKKINEQKTNLIFCEGYGGMPVKGIVDLCKKYGIQFHFWDIESPVTPEIALNMLPHCDFMWSTCIEYIEKFKNTGYKSDLLLFGCNNDFHKPFPSESRFKHDISIVGSNYSNRFNETKEFVIPLLENNLDVMVYGICWMDSGRPVNLLKYPNNYWQEKGVNIISSLSWGQNMIYDFTFAGIPQGTTVATSFVCDELDDEEAVEELKTVLEMLKPCKVFIKTSVKTEEQLKKWCDFEVIPPYKFKG